MVGKVAYCHSRPGPPSTPFGSKPDGQWRIATSGKTTFVVFLVLGGSVRGTRSPSLTSFLPLTSHARVICGENGFVHQKHLKNKRTARSPRKGIRFAQPENDLEGNLSFRFNPPTPPFNSSLFLSVIHVLQASQKHGQRAGRVVKPVRKFPGRKFFYGNRKKILLGKTVTLMKVTAPCPDWLLLPTCWPALRARPLCCM